MRNISKNDPECDFMYRTGKTCKYFMLCDYEHVKTGRAVQTKFMFSSLSSKVKPAQTSKDCLKVQTFRSLGGDGEIRISTTWSRRSYMTLETPPTQPDIHNLENTRSESRSGALTSNTQVLSQIKHNPFTVNRVSSFHPAI